MKNLLFLFSIILLSSCTSYISTGLVVYEESDKKLVSIAGTNMSFWSTYPGLNFKSVVAVKSESAKYKNPVVSDIICNHAEDHCHFVEPQHVRYHIRPAGGNSLTIGGENYYSAETSVTAFNSSSTATQNAWTKQYQGSVPNTSLYLLFMRNEDKQLQLINGHPIIMDLTNENH